MFIVCFAGDTGSEQQHQGTVAAPWEQDTARQRATSSAAPSSQGEPGLRVRCAVSTRETACRADLSMVPVFCTSDSLSAGCPACRSLVD